MHTVLCSGRLLGGYLPGGYLPMERCLPTGDVYPSIHWGRLHPPVNRMTERQVLKHNLSATSFADGKYTETFQRYVYTVRESEVCDIASDSVPGNFSGPDRDCLITHHTDNRRLFHFMTF